MGRRVRAFISYAHADRSYLRRLLIHLKPLSRYYKFAAWSDRKLKAGDDWLKRIEKNIQRAQLIILLVSADFLASDFISQTEVPAALQKAKRDKVPIICVIVSPCLFEESPELGRFQAINNPKSSLQSFEDKGVEQEKIFVRVARRVLSELRRLQ